MNIQPGANESAAEVARIQDAKLSAWLDRREPTRFWYASYVSGEPAAERAVRLYGLGFDNYPAGRLAFGDWWLLFERLMGGWVRAGEGRAGNPFSTWCEPCIEQPGEVRDLAPRLDADPLWGACATSRVVEWPSRPRLGSDAIGCSPRSHTRGRVRHIAFCSY